MPPLIYTHLAVALFAASVAGGTAWNVRGWKADAAQADIVAGLHAAAAAHRTHADAQAQRFEVARASLARSRQVITKEVEHVVERPVYRDGVCLDADGVRLVAAAVAGDPNTGQPAPAVPAASGAR